MTRIGCRAHDYGKLPATALAATLRAKGYNAAQLAMPRAIAGIEDFSHITDKQLAEIRTAFAAQDVEISVLSCYQDLSAPDADTRRTAVDTVKRTLGCAKLLGAKMVGSETAWGACTDEEKAVRRPLMLDSIARITEEAARLNVVFAVESVDVHPLCTPELLRTVLDTAADIQHCKVIFDPVNPVLCQGRAGQSVPDCPLEPLAGGHRQSARCRTRQGLPHRGGRQQNAAAAGRGRYGLFCHSRLSGEPCARSTAAAR